MKIIEHIKSMLNDLDYEMWNNRIMSDAIEFNQPLEEVEFYLKNNYLNHYAIEK